jgi:hypothetical protein
VHIEGDLTVHKYRDMDEIPNWANAPLEIRQRRFTILQRFREHGEPSMEELWSWASLPEEEHDDLSVALTTYRNEKIEMARGDRPLVVGVDISAIKGRYIVGKEYWDGKRWMPLDVEEEL